MTVEERIELGVRRTRSRMMAEFPQNPDIILMLECLATELARLTPPRAVIADLQGHELGPGSVTPTKT